MNNFEIIKKNADRGTHQNAGRLYLYVALCYLEGVGTEVDISSALSYLKQASEHGEQVAKRLLAVKMLENSDLESKKMSLELFYELAETENYLPAILHLASLHDQGDADLEIKSSLEVAQKFYWKAANDFHDLQSIKMLLKYAWNDDFCGSLANEEQGPDMIDTVLKLLDEAIEYHRDLECIKAKFGLLFGGIQTRTLSFNPSEASRIEALVLLERYSEMDESLGQMLKRASKERSETMIGMKRRRSSCQRVQRTSISALLKNFQKIPQLSEEETCNLLDDLETFIPSSDTNFNLLPILRQICSDISPKLTLEYHLQILCWLETKLLDEANRNPIEYFNLLGTLAAQYPSLCNSSALEYHGQASEAFMKQFEPCVNLNDCSTKIFADILGEYRSNTQWIIGIISSRYCYERMEDEHESLRLCLELACRGDQWSFEHSIHNLKRLEKSNSEKADELKTDFGIHNNFIEGEEEDQGNRAEIDDS